LWHFEGRTAFLIPIPRDLRDSLKGGQRGGHGDFLVPLSEAGLLHIYPFSKEKHESYCYEADFPLRQEFMRLMIENSFQKLWNGIENDQMDLVDLASGKEVSKKTYEKSIVSNNKNQLHNIQAEAVAEGLLTKEVAVNIQLAYEILRPRRDEAMAAGDIKALNSTESDLMKIIDLQKRSTRYEYQRLIDPSDGKLKEYKILIYYQSFNYPDYLGRIYDKNASYVGISSEIKSALRYAYYKGQMQYNYDLQGCYPNILKTLGEKYNIEDPLFQDRNIKEKRKEISKELSVNEKLIKGCINSTIFGAYLPSKKQALKELEKSENDMISIPRLVWEHSNNEDEYLLILDALRPFLKDYKKFIDQVIKAWCDDPTNRSGKAYVNGVGRSFTIKGKYTKEEKNLLQTFILQGLEGAFILKLITLGSKYGYEPTHCEHDGLSAIGRIPAAAIQEAKEFSGFKYASLELKDNTHQDLIKEDKTT
jgi:hypothetical protein